MMEGGCEMASVEKLQSGGLRRHGGSEGGSGGSSMCKRFGAVLKSAGVRYNVRVVMVY